MHALDDVTDVNFIAIPGASDPAVLSAAIGYCGTRQDCFFIADAPGKRDKNTPVTDPPQVDPPTLDVDRTTGYYADSIEGPGMWLGMGAATLGL